MNGFLYTRMYLCQHKFGIKLTSYYIFFCLQIEKQMVLFFWDWKRLEDLFGKFSPLTTGLCILTLPRTTMLNSKLSFSIPSVMLVAYGVNCDSMRRQVWVWGLLLALLYDALLERGDLQCSLLYAKLLVISISVVYVGEFYDIMVWLCIMLYV